MFFRPSTFLLPLVLLPITTQATPVHTDDLEIDRRMDDILEGRQSSNSIYPITGVPGKVYPRLEIRQMYNNEPDQWNLYLLGLQQFMKKKQDHKLSFYQIAGIHGVPNIPWDGVGPNPASGGAIGYCPHSSVDFPGWHRGFVALFERVLVHHVRKVAKGFPAGAQRDKYVAAGKAFRAPYWDWAAAPGSGPTFPAQMTTQYSTVMTKNGPKSISNPLFQYSFHPLNPGDMIYQPWSQWDTTLRWPTTNTTGAVSQNNQAQAAIESSRLNRRDDLYNMFVNCNQFLEMSNDAASSSSTGCSTSLEAIHNGVHSLVGGDNDGHMTWLWWAAFDPAFFLHHANVDRLFALWQAVYPNSYGATQIAPGSTYTIAAGDIQGPNSPLTPFHADTSGNFWTTNGVRDWTIFGYTYPEFSDSDGSASSIRTYINRLYGPNADLTAGSTKVKRELNLDLSAPLPKELLAKTMTGSGAKYEYFANVAAPRFALNGSYNVFLFMGGPTDEHNPSQWLFDQNLIGTVNVFAQPNMQHNELLSSGSVPLTRSLTSILSTKVSVQGKVLTGLDKTFVVPFLQKTLEWRVATVNNVIVDLNAIPGFEVSVVHALAQPATSEADFPSYSSFSILPDITDDKKGGLKLGAVPACERILPIK